MGSLSRQLGGGGSLSGEEQKHGTGFSYRLRDLVNGDDRPRSQTTLGEYGVIAGLLSLLGPTRSLEIGTAEGGTLRLVSRFSKRVDSFDLVEPDPSLGELENVTFHTGDSHELLPSFLRELEDEQSKIDFVFVDGDHTSEGVQRDILDLLESPTTDETAILIHDTFNPDVREGVTALNMLAYPKVCFYDPDLVAGHLGGPEGYEGTMWGGIGLIVTDSSKKLYDFRSPFEELFGLATKMQKFKA